MGLFSAIFGKKQSSKVNIPSWVQPGLKSFSGDISKFLKTDPQQYVAGPTALQNTAFTNAGNLGGSQQPLNNALAAVQAAGQAPAANAGSAAQSQGVHVGPMSTVNGSSLLDNFSAYQNPATENLVNSTMANYNRNAEQQRAQVQAQLAGNGAWGSGGRFYQSNFDLGNLLQGAQLENQLRSDAFNTALNASNMDAGRRQDASVFNAGAQNNAALQQASLDSNNNMFNAGQSNQMGMFNAGMQNDAYSRALQAAGMQGDIANSMGNNQRADVALQGAMGDMQHSISQAQAGAYPTQLLSAAQMFNPLLSTFGQTNTATPSPFQTGLSIASLFASDERLKTNIVRIGDWDDRGDGLGKYEWNWRRDPDGPKVTGVIAQEVERLRPHAYVENFHNGYAGVNYAALGA